MSDPPRPLINFDFSSAEYAERWPEQYAKLRDACPVAYSTSHGGFWLVSSYDDVTRVARDPRRFSSDHDPTGERNGYRGVGIPVSVGTRSLPQEADPPDAVFYRRLINDCFTPAAAERWQPWTAAATHQIIDEHLPIGRLDIADDLGFPVPARFIVALLGLPDEDWPELVGPFHTLVTTPPDNPRYAAAAGQLDDVLDVLREAIRIRRDQPGDDLLSVMLTARSGERALSDDEVLSIGQLLFFGGVDSTTALLGDALHWLDANPAQARRLRAQPELLDAAADEFLRYFSPIHLNGRTVARDTRLGDCTLRSGERLLVSWAGANHDPLAVAEPEQVRFDRVGVRHVAFGAGVHRCLGAHFALMMFKTMLWAVLTRIPDYRVDHAATVRYPSVGQVNGFASLPVDFTPRPPRRTPRPLPPPPGR